MGSWETFEVVKRILRFIIYGRPHISLDAQQRFQLVHLVTEEVEKLVTSKPDADNTFAEMSDSVVVIRPMFVQQLTVL
jgi:hypothetical protein